MIPRNRGFTLVEVLLVIFLMGLISALVLPRIFSTSRGAGFKQLRGAYRQAAKRCRDLAAQGRRNIRLAVVKNTLCIRYQVVDTTYPFAFEDRQEPVFAHSRLTISGLFAPDRPETLLTEYPLPAVPGREVGLRCKVRGRTAEIVEAL